METVKIPVVAWGSKVGSRAEQMRYREVLG